MHENLTGIQLGDFIIGHHLGSGGMGSVYQAFHDDLKEPLAIKVMLPESAGNEELRWRFEREAEVLKKLQHPHIVPIYAFGTDQGYLYLVMHRVRGLALDDLMKRRRFSPLAAWWILYPVAQALDYAHAQNIIHRDIKPGNVLVEYVNDPTTHTDVHIYLSDFGLSKVVGAATMTISGTSTLSERNVWVEWAGVGRQD